MIEIKKKIERILALLQDQQFFQDYISKKLQILGRNYATPNENSFFGVIRLMSMCLVVDHFTLQLKPDNQELKVFSELNSKKQSLMYRIKQELAILTMQGKLKQYTKSEGIQIIVVKVTNDVINLSTQKQEVNQQQLFKRLNYILMGVNITSKSYKFVLNKTLNLNIQKRRIQNQQKLIDVCRDNSEFRKIFFSLSDLKKEQKKAHDKKTSMVIDNNKKISNIISKVRQTIQIQSKRFQSLGQRSKKEKRIINKQIKQECENQKQVQKDLEIQVRKKSSSRIKRHGAINEDQQKFKFQQLKKLPINTQQYSDQQSFQSVPCTDENWYKPQNNIRIKKIYTVNLPGFTNLKIR